MQLTRYTDYGFRLLTYLVLLPEGKRASIGEISDLYGISRNHVNKIVHQLGKEGIIDTKQGKGGGFCLNMAPQDINIGDVLLILENNIQVVDCQTPQCRIASACELKDILQEAMAAFLNTLRKYTLADLLNKKQNNLIQLLNLESG